MILMIRKEIENALNNKMYMAALIDSLSLIDGISKVEYPTERQQKRYKQWWDKYAKRTNDPLNGEVVYDIRCFIVHENKMSTHSGTIKHLDLLIEEEIDNGIYLNHYIKDAGIYGLSLKGFCIHVMNSFEDYYKNNKEKVDRADSEINVTTKEDLISFRTMTTKDNNNA